MMLEELAWRIPVRDAFALWVAPSGSVAEALYKAFKFGGKRQLGPPLGAMMAAYRDAWLQAPDLVIPVPLSSKRMWSRGYNQAAELARVMAHIWSVPVMEHALRRNEGGMNLARLGRRERFAKAATDFVQGFGPNSQNKGYDLAGLRCLLVDDVMTTGATLEQCGKLLVERGALLSVMVLARKLGQRS
jgi:ComF family protein